MQRVMKGLEILMEASHEASTVSQIQSGKDTKG